MVSEQLPPATSSPPPAAKAFQRSSRCGMSLVARSDRCGSAEGILALHAAQPQLRISFPRITEGLPSWLPPSLCRDPRGPQEQAGSFQQPQVRGSASGAAWGQDDPGRDRGQGASILFPVRAFPRSDLSSFL